MLWISHCNRIFSLEEVADVYGQTMYNQRDIQRDTIILCISLIVRIDINIMGYHLPDICVLIPMFMLLY